MNVIGTLDQTLDTPSVRLLLIAIGATILIRGGARRAALVAGDDPRAGVPGAARAILLVVQPGYGARLALVTAGFAVLGWMVILRGGVGCGRCWPGCSRRALRACWQSSWPRVRRRPGEGEPSAPCAAGLSTHPAAPTADEINIAVIGGSAAYGLPFEKWLSTGHIVAWKLGEAIPGGGFGLMSWPSQGSTSMGCTRNSPTTARGSNF